ncbi:MAG: hypothetical protein SOR89_04625 [Ndongobacter sp.]|nr:hypothetical protein [Ndongobacter sp.]
MSGLIGLELKKMVRSRTFRLAAALILLLTALDVFLGLQHQHRIVEYCALKFSDPSYGGANPLARHNNLFFFLPGASVGTYATYLAKYVLPLLICLAVGGGLAAEMRRGYWQQVIARVGKKRYYTAKFSASFLLSGMLGVVPLLLSAVVLALFVPASTPEPSEWILHGISMADGLAHTYFSVPWLSVLLLAAFQFVYAGLWTCLSLCIAFYVRTAQAATLSVLLPPIGLFTFDYISEAFLFDWEWSPVIFLNLSPRAAKHHLLLMLLMALGLAAAIGGVVYYRGVKRDVL